MNAQIEDQGLASQGAKKTRLERERENRKDEVYNPVMPPCDALFLIGYLRELGWQFASGGMGPAMPEMELDAWQRNTGIELEPWQSRFMKMLSGEYSEQLQKSTKLDCPAPWTQEITEEDRFAVAKRIRSFLRE